LLFQQFDIFAPKLRFFCGEEPALVAAQRQSEKLGRISDSPRIRLLEKNFSSAE
jgi:hypothetical protein